MQVSKFMRGYMNGYINYRDNPLCVSSALEDKWYVIGNKKNWKKESTIKIACTGKTIIVFVINGFINNSLLCFTCVP